MMLSLIAAAATAFAGVETVVPTPSSWLQQPTTAELAAAYPEMAAQSRAVGSGSIYCRVNEAGSMRDCQVQSDRPHGKGFGEAALSVARDFRMAPPSLGRGDKAFVVIPVHFDRHVRAERDRMAAVGPMIASPGWSRAPSFADVAAAYPARARGVDGSTTLLCRFGTSGSLSRCEVMRESPAGLGFGEAARSLAAKFTVSVDPSWSMAGTRFQVVIPIRMPSPDRSEMRDRLIGEPVWTTRFTPTAASDFFPSEAGARGLSTGRGVAECKVTAGGALESCRPLSAEPEGAGFAQAAAKAASNLRMSPWTRDGGPVDGASVRVPIRFNVDDSPAGPASGRIVWLRTPTGEDVLHAFPRRALLRNVGGQVDLRCKVGETGAVEQCAVVDEAPAGWGFGSAAQQLATDYRVSMSARTHPAPGSWIVVSVPMEITSH